MKYTAIGILVGAVIGHLLMAVMEGDALIGMAGVTLAGAMGAVIDMVAAKRRPHQSEGHPA